MDDPTVKSPQVTPNIQRMGPSSRHMAVLNWEAYRWLIDTVGITNKEMARATGMSESYAAGVGSGTRIRVNTDFVNRAAIYIAARMSEPVVVARILLTQRH